MAQDGDAYGNTVTFNKCCSVMFGTRDGHPVGLATHTHQLCLSKDLACN